MHCANHQTPVSVGPYLTQLSSRLTSLPIDASFHSEILSFAPALLTAGDMAMSAGPGRVFDIRALSVTSLGLMLCGVLAELSWGGWKLVGHPSLLSATRTLLESEPSLTLRLLAYLQNAGKLGEVDIVWDRVVFSELQQPQGARQNPDRMTTTADGGNEMDLWEEERSWRDPSAHRLCGAAVTWLDRHQQRKIIISLRLVADARLASH
jgi:hypothetical protein